MTVMKQKLFFYFQNVMDRAHYSHPLSSNQWPLYFSFSGHSLDLLLLSIRPDALGLHLRTVTFSLMRCLFSHIAILASFHLFLSFQSHYLDINLNLAASGCTSSLSVNQRCHFSLIPSGNIWKNANTFVKTVFLRRTDHLYNLHTLWTYDLFISGCQLQGDMDLDYYI